MKLVPIDSQEAEKIDTSFEPEIGQWYWLKLVDKEKGEHKVLTCIVHVGSNYVTVRGPDTTNTYYEDGTKAWRVHIDKFDDELTFEPNPQVYIETMITKHKDRAHELLHEVKRLCAALGISPTQKLTGGPDTTGTALAVAAGTENLKAYETALIKAKKETLPELFSQVEQEHKWLAKWMKVRTIPERARLDQYRKSIDKIDGQIFTVELYAGLIEQLVQVRDGEPATLDDKLYLFQRRHYMDEECLVNYKAGGMRFADLGAFDAWIAEPENRDRILAKPRSIVAFKVRRDRRSFDYDEFDGAPDISDYINFWNEEKLDALTFLYIRNGEQVWRLSTKIEFGEQLFPDREHSELLGGGQLYYGGRDKVITEREYLEYVDEMKKSRAEHAEKLKAWKKEPKKKRGFEPHFYYDHDKDPRGFDKVSRESLYHDDAMEILSTMIREHNQIAVLLQGLLDRSLALHPHPPWRLWTPEGFLAGIALIYDDTRALVDGDKPDFEAYRMRLNQSLQRGSLTVGQEELWMRHEAMKENERRNRNWRQRSVSQLKRFRPDGNPGPGLIAKVIRLGRDGQAHYEWARSLRGYTWQDHPTRNGYVQYRQREGERRSTFHCPMGKLFNVSAYQAGDYKQFYNDPRTRAEYMKWAVLLLAAEDYVNGFDSDENFTKRNRDPEEEANDD